jgi:hypothetical protein
MITSEQCILVVLSAALLCTSCAISPEAQERRQAVEEDIEAILSEPLDVEQYGETQRCLAAREYRDFRAIDDQRILFESRRGKLWLNTLRMRCPDLRHATVLRVRSISTVGRICDMDTFEAGDWFTWPWYRRWPWHWGTRWGTGMTCSLGKFQPVTAAQVEAIEAALKSK